MFCQDVHRRFRTAFHAMVGLTLGACATTGADAVLQDLAVDPCYDPIGEGRVFVWGSEPEIATALTKWASGHDLTVVRHPDAPEPVRDRPRQVVVPTDDVLRNLAKSHGAQRVLVATAEKTAHPLTYRYAGYSEGPPWLTTVYDPTITIRSLGGPEPIVYWTVIARGPATTFSWGRGLEEISNAALQQVESRAEANVRKRGSCSIRQNDR